MFIKNIWYACAWDHEVPADKPFGLVVAGEPVVLWRDSTGTLNAFADRCPHRHAPLSLGRIEGDELRCMYHGMKFSRSGECVHIPASDQRPPNCDVRRFAVEERDGWIWVWPGEAALADADTIPQAWGLNTDKFTDRSGALEYDADYQLINDNLTDLSHLDYVHETTLGAASGVKWSEEHTKITKLENGLRIERWFPPSKLLPDSDMEFESWNSYDYLLPGVFLMVTSLYPVGSAEACNYAPPKTPPLFSRYEQQAVTPVAPGKSRYIFASGLPREFAEASPEFAEASPENVEMFFAVVMAAFAEDKAMIEAQQKIWDMTPESEPKAFIEQDKAPAMLRRMIKARLREETKIGNTALEATR